MLTALALAAFIVPGDPDGVVTTAPRGPGAVIVGAEAPTTDAQPNAAQLVATTPHNLTTQEQIDRWVSARATDTEPFAANRGPQTDDREMHGFVSGAIGTNDFTSVAVGVSLPIGDSARIGLTFSQTKNGWPALGHGYGHPGDYSYGGYRLGPLGGYEPAYGVRGRSSRSALIGFTVDDDSRRDHRATRPIGITADE